MITIRKWRVYGWEMAVMGMRNPMNSWSNSDSLFGDDGTVVLGNNDLSLMKSLAAAGGDHRKFMRMIGAMIDISAPLYWWKEFDTYKVGTVANSCSTMHKIAAKEFTLDDFSREHLIGLHDNFASVDDCMCDENDPRLIDWCGGNLLCKTIDILNFYREKFLDTGDKKYWWQLIQLLPSSYNQLRTVSLNYEVLRNMYNARHNHKLDEWRDFCDWIYDCLPYMEDLLGNPAVEVT